MRNKLIKNREIDFVYDGQRKKREKNSIKNYRPFAF